VAGDERTQPPGQRGVAADVSGTGVEDEAKFHSAGNGLGAGPPPAKLVAMPTPSQRVLSVLTGCTATGKTEWALRWAEAHGAEIVSCDALLFYRGMDIGTAKPTPAEQARVPHHLIDVCDVTDRMDVTRYVAWARDAAEQIAARGRRVLVTGGSGFYLKAFFAPVADDVAVPPAVRARVAELDPAAAVAELRRLNPAGWVRSTRPIPGA
jgi:tRNA A37 N6-isopentenylltransferase MiaA